jgi:hypothetical protein
MMDYMESSGWRSSERDLYQAILSELASKRRENLNYSLKYDFLFQPSSPQNNMN